MAGRFLVSTGALTGTRIAVVVLTVATLPVFARYLTIAEFGIMSIAMSVVVFGQILSDGGLGRSLIRQPTVDPAEWNSVFWLLVVIGTALTAILVTVAPAWAWFFDLPSVAALVSALAVIPFLQAIAAVPIARMERDDRFVTLAAVRLAAALIALAFALGLAVAGAGVWALVGQQIMLAAVQSLAPFALSRFRPGAPRRFTPLRQHIRFARDNVGVSLLMTGQRQAPVLLIGLVLGAVPLGLFAMGQRFWALAQTGLAGPAAQVAYVRMAAAARDGAACMGRIYVATTRLLALAILPPVAALSAAGPAAFPLLLGAEWRGVAAIFALAAPGIALEAATSAAGVLFQAVDRTGLRVRMAAERAICRSVAIAVAVPFGLTAVAAAISLFALAYTPRYWWWARRAVRFDRIAALRAVAMPGAAAILVAAAGVAAIDAFDPFAAIAATTLALAVSWGGILFALRRTIAEDLRVLGR